MKLFLLPTSPETRSLYETAAEAYNRVPMKDRNSGFDLYCNRILSENEASNTIMVGQGCHAVAMDEEGRTRAYWLVPRSSISKTAFALRNSMGLIDATYRGELIAAIGSVVAPPHPVVSPLIGTRICQLARPDLLPWTSVEVVTELPDSSTLRGSGGFGSTGTS